MTCTLSRCCLSLVLVLGLSAAGCSSRTFPPSYINIPPENGDWAFNDPNARDVREIKVLAVRKSLEREPIGGPYELRLPERTEPVTYALVARELGADALVPAHIPAVAFDEDGKPIPPEEGEFPVAPTQPEGPLTLGEFPTIEVRAIRVRAGDGQVDLVRPSTTGRRLTTVYLDWEPGHGWHADKVRAWRVDPDRVPQPIGPTPRGSAGQAAQAGE
ncbi:MAG: hypothetical protein AAFX76_11835 [Planctomycetota bacterium]